MLEFEWVLSFLLLGAMVGFVAGMLGYLINGWSIDAATSDTLGFIYIPAFLLISLTCFVTASYGVKASHYLPVNVFKKFSALLLIFLSLKCFHLLSSFQKI